MSHRTLNATAAQALAAIMNLHDLTDSAVGEACSKDRTWVEGRRNGRVGIKLDDLGLLAEALELPVSVFFMEPREAVVYSLEHPSEQGIRRTIWNTGAYRVVSEPTQLTLGDAAQDFEPSQYAEVA